MTPSWRLRVRLPAAVIALLLPGPPGLRAQPTAAPLSAPSTEDLVRALTPGATARSLGTRNLRVEAPTVDLTVNFDLDSARLQPDARALVERLAAAMDSPTLRTLRFRVEGHTDARGTPAHNAALSTRRARAVVDLLIARGIGGDRLEAVGKGFSELLDPADPHAALNRRVRVRVLD
jgi:outer membrane protein OmpA-like peptidoglycan-associated protein